MDSNITKKKNAKREYIYRKRIPYGIMNFVTVRRDYCYYVDPPSSFRQEPYPLHAQTVLRHQYG